MIIYNYEYLKDEEIRAWEAVAAVQWEIPFDTIWIVDTVNRDADQLAVTAAIEVQWKLFFFVLLFCPSVPRAVKSIPRRCRRCDSVQDIIFQQLFHERILLFLLDERINEIGNKLSYWQIIEELDLVDGWKNLSRWYFESIDN